MTSPINVRADFERSRDEMRRTLNVALVKRRPPLGFVIGLLATLAVFAASTALALRYLG